MSREPQTHRPTPPSHRTGWLLALLLGLPAAALAEGGAVTGAVEATPAKFLEETVVYLTDAPKAPAPRTVEMDQNGMRFLPHVLAVAVGDTVRFANHDKVVHNVFTPDQGGYNLGNFGTNENRTYVFTKPGVYAQLCSLHPEMLAYIYVSPSPYAAVVEKDGRFAIKDVPPGTYHIAVWNSHLKAPEQSVTVAAGKTAEVRFSVHR